MKNTLIGVFAGFVNGLLGSGGGTIIVPALEIFDKTEAHKAHATSIAVILPLSVISAVIYFYKGTLVWKSILYVALGSVPGSLIGALLLKNLSTAFLNKLFGIVMLSAAIRMFFT